MVEIGSTTYTAQPIGSFVIVGSNTITQGAPPVTIASTAISLGTNRVLIDGSSSLTIDSPTHLLAPQPSVSPPASLSSPISVAWATSVVTSGGLSASYVETQFSNLATITAPTLVPTHITISGSAGQTSVVSITESVNTGGFYFSPIPVIGPGGSPSLPQIPGPRGPPDSPSCWKLGVISVGNCGEGSKNNNNNNNNNSKKSSEDTHSSTESSSSATSASSDQSSSQTSSSSSSCSSTTLTDYSIIYDASVSSYSTHSYTTLASCGVSPATTTVSATASCSGECSIGQFTFASVHADSYSNVGEAAITSAEQYILGVLSTASWGVNATVTAPNSTSSASPTTTADPICAVQ